MIEQTNDFMLVNARFPRIGHKLLQLWGTAAFLGYIDELQNNTRPVQRAGFPADVLLALTSLADAHDVAFPSLARNPNSVWNLNKTE